MQKRAPIIILALVALVLIWSVFVPDTSEDGASVLGESATITVYAIEDAPTGGGFVEFTPNGDTAETRYLNILLAAASEENAEEGGFVQIAPPTLTIGEQPGDSFPGLTEPQRDLPDAWLVRNVPVRPVAGETIRLAFRVPAELDAASAEVPLAVALTKERAVDHEAAENAANISFTAAVEQVRLVEEFGYNVPGSSEYLKRGIPGGAALPGVGIPVAHAQLLGMDFFAGRDTDVPDLDGGPMDCVPIAVTNNLISLVNEHGFDVDLPEPEAMIDELKEDMQFNNGVLAQNFLAGKNAFVARYNLPVTTRTIARPSMADIEEALNNGDAIEISLSFIRSASGRPNAGHVITGVGAFEDGGDAGLTVKDPATDVGNDFLDVTQSGGDTPYLLLDYPFWDGVTVIDAIHVQTWTGPTQTGSTGTDPMTETEEASGNAETGDGEEVSTNPSEEAYDALGFYTEMSYAHVAPGEYSEVYVRVPTRRPGLSVGVTLTGPAVEQPATKVVQTDENGEAYVVFRVYQYGTYTAEITIGSTSETNSVVVQ